MPSWPPCAPTLGGKRVESADETGGSGFGFNTMDSGARGGGARIALETCPSVLG